MTRKPLADRPSGDKAMWIILGIMVVFAVIMWQIVIHAGK